VRLPVEDFIVAWQKASCLNDVAMRTGLTRQQASAKATALRSRGVPLKRFTQRTEKDRKRLSEIAEKALEQADERRLDRS